MEQQGWLIKTSWHRGVPAPRDWQLAALLNLDRLKELKSCGIFTDLGGQNLRVGSLFFFMSLFFCSTQLCYKTFEVKTLGNPVYLNRKSSLGCAAHHVLTLSSYLLGGNLTVYFFSFSNLNDFSVLY